MLTPFPENPKMRVATGRVEGLLPRVLSNCPLQLDNNANRLNAYTLFNPNIQLIHE